MRDTPTTAIQKFWGKVNKTSHCWEWTGYIHPKSGYGRHGSYMLAHRFSYLIHKGTIPEGLELDHLCRNRKCVNPEHLEAVTRRENVLRGEGLASKNNKKTHCHHGHPLSGDNMFTEYGKRRCRICHKSRQARYLAKIRVKQGELNCLLQE